MGCNWWSSCGGGGVSGVRGVYLMVRGDSDVVGGGGVSDIGVATRGLILVLVLIVVTMVIMLVVVKLMV